ncbi:DUF6464 family protein [Nostoc sp. TCL240-02]|uniref:DUF6464 family protein n=1 Tax=Nostoc sp. TCL240-02 TaxID=2572090 RepID=UPI00157F9A0A|nr:hypothetical protein FBB35_22175 [Nostoc sp. TCL240-02]
MNQIESILEFAPNCDLRLWTDGTDEIDTGDIKRLIKAVVEQLDLQFRVNAYHDQECQNWTINFDFGRHAPSRQHRVRHFISIEDLERFRENRLFNCVVSEICEYIRRSIPNDANDDGQNWVIVMWRDEHFAKIHQRGKRSVNLILHEVMQDGDLISNHATVTIRARIPSDAVRRGDSVEIGGMLLQGKLLGWVEDGQQGWFLFSPNTQQVNTSRSWADEPRITFTTRPRINRLASFERISQMIEQGQIELPGGGFFDRWLEPLPYLERSIELPGLRRREGAIVSEENRSSFGRLLDRYDDIHAGSEYEGLGLRTCKYNAGSRMLRCAVNPCGPCEGCTHYEKL